MHTRPTPSLPMRGSTNCVTPWAKDDNDVKVNSAESKMDRILLPFIIYNVIGVLKNVYNRLQSYAFAIELQEKVSIFAQKCRKCQI